MLAIKMLRFRLPVGQRFRTQAETAVARVLASGLEVGGLNFRLVPTNGFEVYRCSLLADPHGLVAF